MELNSFVQLENENGVIPGSVTGQSATSNVLTVLEHVTYRVMSYCALLSDNARPAQ